MRTIRAFMWGTAIGAMIGLLFAPQRGELNRNQLQDRLNDWQGRAKTQVGNIRSRTNQLIEQGRKTTNSALRQASKTTNSAASSMQDAIASTGTGTMTE